jgi:hypothetical protein
VQAGAIFVNISAKNYLEQVLLGVGLSSADVEEYANRGVKDFENKAKRAFRDTSVDQSIEIAGSRFNNMTIRTRRGHMTLLG